ncbi:hypothetical protein D5018_00885 [Parashewanella curva]|uniref:Uncharacterized protein n=1 Tax=Parashewanella curva TaxID=2338552 RepID=A0A3L8Q272_9GAMM|nr:hypothetical protein [Parashewanella curva]RLV61705.1 hypothetical protein D5018_00885 [Parashewanella curva]
MAATAPLVAALQLPQTNTGGIGETNVEPARKLGQHEASPSSSPKAAQFHSQPTVGKKITAQKAEDLAKEASTNLLSKDYSKWDSISPESDSEPESDSDIEPEVNAKPIPTEWQDGDKQEKSAEKNTHRYCVIAIYNEPSDEASRNSLRQVVRLITELKNT